MRVQGRPGSVHPSPGRAPGSVPSRSLPRGARVLTARGTLPQLPISFPKHAAKEPFSRRKKKKNRLNETSFRVDRNKVMKFITAGKQVLAGSHLRCRREWNRRTLRGTVAGRSEPLGPGAGALELAEAAARRAVSLRPQQGTPGTRGPRDRVGGPFPPRAPLSDPSKAARLTSSPGWG